MMINPRIIGTGHYLPSNVVSNDALSTRVDTSDAWIRERTGIAQRHIAAEGELTSDLAAAASKEAIANAGITAAQIDMIIVATTTPDSTFPSTAAQLQAKLGIGGCAAFDVQAVCTGFIYALATAKGLMQSGQYKHALVVGAETITRILDWEDRATCVLFGDGAGAVVLHAEEDVRKGILSTHLYADGNHCDILHADGGVSQQSVGLLRMQGKEVFKHAVTKMIRSTNEALEANNYTAEQVDWVIPHQANQRIMDAVIQKMKLPEHKLVSCVAEHANTSAATIPLALHVAVQDGRVQKDHVIATQAVGGGLTWGSALIVY